MEPSSGGGGRGVRRGLWGDRGGRGNDGGCAEHDRAGPEGIGAGRAARLRGGMLSAADSATGSGTQENDLQEPALEKAGDPTLLADLEALVEPTTRGDPESPLRWTCKSVRRLAQALQAQGHEVSRTLVARLLNGAGYSLQGNRKTTEGDSHPDRDAQFGYINTQVTTALAENQPVISADTKKRNWSGISATTGANIAPKATRKKSGSMTS
jgi:hypothetical protein